MRGQSRPAVGDRNGTELARCELGSQAEYEGSGLFATSRRQFFVTVAAREIIPDLACSKYLGRDSVKHRFLDNPRVARESDWAVAVVKHTPIGNASLDDLPYLLKTQGNPAKSPMRINDRACMVQQMQTWSDRLRDRSMVYNDLTVGVRQ